MTQGKNVSTNFIWRFLERCGAQGVSFVVSIILARLLDPTVYGTVALVNVFTAILEVFITHGLGTALIQKKDADDLDFSTAFYFNVAVCLFLYAGMFFAAPLIAKFYNRPELTPLVRVLSLTIVISGVKNIQHAYVARQMQFKRFFFATLGGTIGAAVIGIFLAYKGFGVWAIVAQSLFNHTVDTIILWITVKWRPKWKFSFARLKILYSYGWKLLVSALLDKGYTELRSLIIGKMYAPESLAFYNKGQHFPNSIVSNINSSIDSVLLPSMSRAQDSKARVKSMTRRAIKTSSYLMMPLMMGLAVCATPLIDLLLTAKWLPCVMYMRIFCFTCAFHTIHTANLNAIKAMGRSDLFLKLEIMKKVIGLASILITMWISVEAMAYSLLITSVLSQIINSWPNKKLMNYSYLEQLRDILPHIGLSVLMGAIVYCVTIFKLPDILTLCIQVPLGAAVYIGASKLFKVESFHYVLDMAKSYLPKKKAKTENK